MKNIFILFMLFSFLGNSQTLRYQITSNGSYIGDLKVTKVVKDNTIQIEAVSEVKVHLYLSIDFKYKLNCTYKNNELLYSSLTTYVNGKVHSTSKTEKVGNYYTLTKDGHSSKFIDNITFSGALLYYQEPEGLEHIYSEFDNMDKPIIKIGINEYQLTNPENGHLSEYIYQNGVLVSLTNHHTLLTFKLSKI